MTTRLEPVAWRFLYGNAPEGCWSYSNTAPDEADKNHKRVQPLYAAAPTPDGMREAVVQAIYCPDISYGSASAAAERVLAAIETRATLTGEGG